MKYLNEIQLERKTKYLTAKSRISKFIKTFILTFVFHLSEYQELTFCEDLTFCFILCSVIRLLSFYALRQLHSLDLW